MPIEIFPFPFPDVVIRFFRRCRPRLLIVTDSALSFSETSGFGLWRFLHSITAASGVTLKPVLTLAYRGTPFPSSITIDGETFTVTPDFEFHTATPSVTVANYDQIWLFGFSSAALQAAEIATIAEFMNSGGGVFATGDHGTIGIGLCGSLPRIRHMREWSSIPMGTEPNPAIAVQRIDTVVDPGSNDLYEFEDQSDAIPQRIYPNYAVTAGASGWEARLHPVLRLPGAADVRLSADGNLGFTKDMDMLPDHPHESVCYAVDDPAVLSGTYTDAGLNFAEYPASVTTPGSSVGAEIVAYGVAGGRSVRNGPWKPPVRPRMFGIISAYDGRAAQPYAGKTARPGRIVCDSTWHHYVNINLDGRGTSRNGLGSWSGGVPGAGTFTPSVALEKIYGYYRNMVAWLQPANRIWCRVWWDLIVIRFHPALIEELLEAPRLTEWHQLVGLGMEAERLLETWSASPPLEDLVRDVFLENARTQRLAALLEGDATGAPGDRRELARGIFGSMLARVAMMLPLEDPDAALAALEGGPEKHAKELSGAAVDGLKKGVREQSGRAERVVRRFQSNDIRRVLSEE